LLIILRKSLMSFDPCGFPGLLTSELPGIGGQIKTAPEDFVVEEIPAYKPAGTGDFLFLWIEKRDMGAEYFQRQIAQRLQIAVGEVGTAGLKDRHAITRQTVSVPLRAEPLLGQLDGDGIRILEVSRHTNKLKPGHLHGNRFRILIRNPLPGALERLQPVLTRICDLGLPNYYGQQRFGREGETVKQGFALLRGEPPVGEDGRRVNLRSPFLRKLALSAAQSALFNHYLSKRMADGLLRVVLQGDVMAKWPFGGMFQATELAKEQERFDKRETIHAGPMFGKKTFPATGEAEIREASILQEAGLTAISFHGFGKLLQGTRRHNLIYVDDLDAVGESEGVRLSFTLPAGSYATVLLREICKGDDVSKDIP
jgi:tRNA pseudouridine13 synthase